MKANFIFIAMFFCSLTSFAATDYQKQIEKNYPGFQILKKTEFNSNIMTSTNPGLVVGKFNNDQWADFAAMIRTKEKKRYEAGTNSYDYFDGKLVVCHGAKGEKYNCQAISEVPVTLPLQSYLSMAKPQKTGCYNDKGSKDIVDVKTDSIGWYSPEKGGSQYIFQKDGSYMNCVTSD